MPGVMFFGFSIADWGQGCSLGEPSCTGMEREVQLFVFLPVQCCSSRVHGVADPTKDAYRLLLPCLGFDPGTAISGSGQENQGECFKTQRRVCLGGAHTPLENIPACVHHSLLPAFSSFFPPCIPKGGSKGLLGAP